MLHISGTDGDALLGYAGLGTSLAGTQPSDWMNDVLAEHHALSIESQIGVIANAMKADLPPQLRRMAGAQAHHLIATAIVSGEPRLYGVGLALCPLGGDPSFIHTRYARTESGGPPPRFAVAGSGVNHMPKGKAWARDILRVVRGVEAGRVNPLAVADRLAVLNAEIASRDKYVSSNCIVTWRMGGGSTQFYDGRQRVKADVSVPTVARGMDVRLISEATIPFFLETVERMKKGEPHEYDGSAIQAAIDKLSMRPKRKL
jgi:hypothetical protein